MKIIPSANLGELGSNEGQATVYNWKVGYSLLGALLWLALILAFAVPRNNHNYRVLFILISLLIANGFWWLFIKILPRMLSSDAIQFGTLFQSLVVSLTILWLMAHKLKLFNGVVRFFMALGIVVAVSFLGILSIFSYFDNQILLILALFAFITIAMLIGFAISGWLCRKRYQPVAFLLWLALWLPLCSLFAIIGFVGVGIIITHSTPPKAAYIEILIVGLCLGLFLYVVNLPYFILGFLNPFFRERFCACLNLKSMSAITNADQSNEQI